MLKSHSHNLTQIAMLFWDIIIVTRSLDIRVHGAGSQLKMSECLNNFCFHVYAQKSLIISEIGNVHF